MMRFYNFRLSIQCEHNSGRLEEEIQGRHIPSADSKITFEHYLIPYSVSVIMVEAVIDQALALIGHYNLLSVGFDIKL